MMELNDDVIAHIMACFDMDQVNDCYYLASTCSRFYNCLQKNKTKIDDHFTHVMIEENRETHYYGNKKHRNGDKPAVIWPDGAREWYKYDKLHRSNLMGTDGDKPAIIYADGTQEWYQNGELHRDGDLPAVIWPDRAQEWYQHGKRHRYDDKPAVIWANGVQWWYKHGIRYDP